MVGAVIVDVFEKRLEPTGRFGLALGVRGRRVERREWVAGMIEQDGVTGLRPRITNGPLPCLVEGREHARDAALGRSYRSRRVHERAVMRFDAKLEGCGDELISPCRKGRDVRIPMHGVGPVTRGYLGHELDRITHAHV